MLFIQRYNGFLREYTIRKSLPVVPDLLKGESYFHLGAVGKGAQDLRRQPMWKTSRRLVAQEPCAQLLRTHVAQPPEVRHDVPCASAFRKFQRYRNYVVCANPSNLSNTED